jgi:hypothetical protein
MFFNFASSNYFKPLKFFIMKRSDLIIIAVGIVIAVAIFAAITYIAITFNNGNAGLNGGF